MKNKFSCHVWASSYQGPFLGAIINCAMHVFLPLQMIEVIWTSFLCPSISWISFLSVCRAALSFLLAAKTSTYVLATYTFVQLIEQVLHKRALQLVPGSCGSTCVTMRGCACVSFLLRDKFLEWACSLQVCTFILLVVYKLMKMSAPWEQGFCVFCSLLYPPVPSTVPGTQ